ncbi:MAG: YabP/YqfC family sporulation protein [Clostridia bacterium]|nr:YabP/YqfC family sporulation protein [Clostridia bacterium]MBR2734890.1 YabP/YqfC family sporulation protein [Clostridia bacterium]
MNFKIKRNFSSELKKANSYMKNNVFDSVHIEMRSNRELILEGCQKIEEYDENIVKIKVPKMYVSVFGRELEIRCLTPDSLIVSGFICCVEFLS